jgi:hypothetical protein
MPAHLVSEIEDGQCEYRGQNADENYRLLQRIRQQGKRYDDGRCRPEERLFS